MGSLKNLLADLTLNYFQVNRGSKTILLQQLLAFPQERLDFFRQIALSYFLPFLGLIQLRYPQVDILQVTRQITSANDPQQCQAVNRFTVCSCLSGKFQGKPGRRAAVIGKQDFCQRKRGMLHIYLLYRHTGNFKAQICLATFSRLRPSLAPETALSENRIKTPRTGESS